MTTTLRSSRAGLPALALAATLSACATTRMNAEWRDPAYTGGLPKGARVLVVCRAPEETLRRVCEDQWAGRLGAQGVAPERSYSIAGFPWASGDTSAEMTAAARESGAVALTVVSLAPGDVAVVSPGPQVGVGVSGGGYRGGGFSVGGIGISFPIGGATTTQSLGASSSFVDLASGRLVWSGSASTPGSIDPAAQVGALAQLSVEAMRKAGLL